MQGPDFIDIQLLRTLMPAETMLEKIPKRKRERINRIVQGDTFGCPWQLSKEGATFHGHRFFGPHKSYGVFVDVLSEWQ